MVLIDTNIFIHYLKNDKKAVDYFNYLKTANEDVYFSFINKVELLSYSQLNNNEIKSINEMLNQFKRIGLDEKIEEKTIDIRKKNRLKIPDSIIAASALNLGCTLVTRNESDFNNVPDLILYNPFS